MKLSISNIGWIAKQDEAVYRIMQNNGFDGLEIAPTRIFLENPYERLHEAHEWSEELHEKYGFTVSSMQSIWYGRQEKIFGTDAEREALLSYTKKAIDFAAAVGCRNLVFGCPRNRNVPKDMTIIEANKIIVTFFKVLGDYAYERGTIVAMEANPPIYNTNFINDTSSAFNLIEKVNSKGFLLNLDLGTMIENGESVDSLVGKISLINHVHISEPRLAIIEKRQLHRDIVSLLEKERYTGYLSIEMGKQDDISILESAMCYVSEIVK